MPKRLIPDFQRSPRVKFDYCLTAACTARQVNSFGNLKRILCLEPTYFFSFSIRIIGKRKEGNWGGRERECCRSSFSRKCCSSERKVKKKKKKNEESSEV